MCTNAPKIKLWTFYRLPLGRLANVGGRIEFALTIPAEAPTTQLREPPLVYWELLVQGNNRLPAVVILPVYAE